MKKCTGYTSSIINKYLIPPINGEQEGGSLFFKSDSQNQDLTKNCESEGNALQTSCILIKLFSAYVFLLAACYITWLYS